MSTNFTYEKFTLRVEDFQKFPFLFSVKRNQGIGNLSTKPRKYKWYKNKNKIISLWLEVSVLSKILKYVQK